MRKEAVSRVRLVQDGEDRYGEPVFTTVTTELPPALFAPGGTSEPIEPGREPVVAAPTLYWPRRWPDVMASDRLIVRGETYSVDGEPAAWNGSLAGGLVVTLYRAKEGAS